MDADHRAVIVVDVESKKQARSIIPPAFRPQAKIVQLNAFTMQQVDEIRRKHEI